MNVFRMVLVLIACILMLSANVDAVLVVNKTSPCTSGDAYFPTITSALSSASSGDTIIVCSGTYLENIDINISVTLKSFSQNPADTTIQALDTNEDVIEVHADYVNISGFTITGGSIKSNDDGIDVEPNPISSDPSDYVNISNNVFYNLYGGIQLENSNFSVVRDNNISGNDYGVYLIESSFNNLIVNNTISGNQYIGIQIPSGCEDNEIYLNRFTNNGQNAEDSSTINYWNSTEMHPYTYQGNVYTNYTGNYWDDYTGVDANNDGIGDTPYNISTGGGEGGDGGAIPLGGGSTPQARDYYPMLFETLSPPVISDIQESDLTNTSIIISWQTSIISNNRILYSLNPDLSAEVWSEWDNNTQNPSITLSSLTPNTTYYYSVFSHRTDNVSIYSNSSIRNFTTMRNTKTWYVDDNGLDCSADFTNIQDAVNASIDGDTIIVCNGTYTGNITVDKSLNISGVGMPFINAFNVGSGFVLSSSNNIIQGFIIDRAGWYELGIPHSDYNYGVYLQSSSDYTTVRNNNITNGGGVYISSSNNDVVHNYFENSSVIIKNEWVNEGRYNNITNNEFYSVYGTPVIQIQTEFSSNINAYNRIENNHINRTEGSTLGIISVERYMSKNIISGNTIEGYGGIRIDSYSNENQIISNTIKGTLASTDIYDVGIKIDSSSYDHLIVNNTIEYKYIGLRIDPYGQGKAINLTIANNTFANNNYHFYINPQFRSFPVAPVEGDFDMNIDTSNIIMENGIKRIYFIKNAQDEVFNSSDVGFFACISCDNITLKYLSLQKNSHGVLLYNTSNSLIDAVNAYNNHLAGIAIYDSENITLHDSWLASNGYSNEGSGLFLGRAENVTVNNSDIETNWCYGINLDHSDNNTILNSNIIDNGPSFKLSPVSDDCYFGGHGMGFESSENNTIKSNYIRALTIPKQGTWEGGQKYGIYSTSSSNNLIYNNYFNNTVNAFDNGNNIWNITRTQGMNIIGGHYLGGNYWHDYTGMDIVGGDGLGDTLLPYNSSGSIQNGGDFLPLTNVSPDNTPPAIYVVSPVEGQTYSASYVYLWVYSPDSDAYRWWYSLNSGQNTTFTPNTTITGLSNGDYRLIIYVNDTSGNENSTTVNFTISVSAGIGGGVVVLQPLEEVTQPDFEIKITNPEKKQYSERDLELSFTSPLPLRRSSFILDGNKSEEISLPPYATSGSKEITRLHLGKHKIIVNGEDYYGKKGRGEAEFEIIPVTLGELNITGTQTVPRFIDDVAFSFFGRSTDYTLRFEATGEAKINVHVNEYFRDGIQPYGNLSGGMIYSFLPNPTYQTYEIQISADNITPDVENVISFISENAGNGEREWEIKNVTLIPSLPFNFPQIRVFTFDKAASENETMTAYLKLDGIINESDYEAYVYIITSEGKKLYYPEWNEGRKTISPYYLRTNYYGRLPSILQFTDFKPGTYILVGKITERGSDLPVSLSTDKVYYSNKTSVKLYVNREIFSEGREIILEHMLTGNGTDNGTIILSMEDPDGEKIYLPMLSEVAEGKGYSPIQSDHFKALDKIVDSSWKEGTYILRSNLFSNSGELIAEDILTFMICKKLTTLSGTYMRLANENDTSPFVLSRIRLIDFHTLKTEEIEFTGDHYGYSVTANSGKYYLTGEAYSKNGRAYYIPLTIVNLECSKNQTRNLALSYYGEVNLSSLPLVTSGSSPLTTSASSFPSTPPDFCLDTEIDINTDTSNSNLIRFQEQNQCSKPKIILYVDFTEKALNKLLKEYPGDTPETLKRYFANELRELLLKISSGVKIYTEIDRLDALREQEDFLLQNPEAQPDLSKFRQTTDAEYLIGLKVDYVYVSPEEMEYFGENKPIEPYESYILTSDLVDIGNALVVWGAKAEKKNVKMALYEIVNGPDPYLSYGDIASHIKLHETQNPHPPRDPSLFITITPETLTFEEDKDRAEIKVEVVDCREKPVSGAKVYFKEITDRGYVKAEGKEFSDSYLFTQGWSPGDYVYAITDSNGIAKAEYILDDSKGVKSGVDKISILTKERGGKLKEGLAIIKIAGIGIEIKPQKDEIGPKEETDLYISLYKEELNGERTPLAGKTILIEKYSLLDGKVVATGETDAYGNPVTDNNGNAVIKFIAGKKEGIAKIPAVYQGLGYDFAPRDEAFIKVKKEEYLISIRWFEMGSGRYSIAWPNKCGDNEETYWGDWKLEFNAKIIWNKYNFREESTAKLSYNSNSNTYYYWLTCGDVYGRCPNDPEKACPLYGIHTEWITRYNSKANVHSAIDEKETYRAIVFQDKAGNLLIGIDPIRVGMPLYGAKVMHITYTVTETKYEAGEQSVSSHSESGDHVLEFNGYLVNPAPPRNPACVLGAHPSIREPCHYYLPDDFPRERVVLKKIGKNSYQSFHFKYPDTIDECIYSTWYEICTYLSGVKEFDVTVVKR
jgi:parallel beta-helix repeat protein